MVNKDDIREAAALPDLKESDGDPDNKLDIELLDCLRSSPGHFFRTWTWLIFFLDSVFITNYIVHNIVAA